MTEPIAGSAPRLWRNAQASRLRHAAIVSVKDARHPSRERARPSARNHRRSEGCRLLSHVARSRASVPV